LSSADTKREALDILAKWAHRTVANSTSVGIPLSKPRATGQASRSRLKFLIDSARITAGAGLRAMLRAASIQR
jgi:hypothetical protein